MNLAQTFAAERPLAQHCEELTMRGPRPEERAESITAWRRDIGRALAEEFAGLLSGGKVKAVIGEPEWLTGKQIFEAIGPVAANSLLRCGDDSHTLLLSFDYPTAVALTDRSFGGDGERSDDPVESLPRSAALLIDQAATLVAQAIASASQASEQSMPKGDVIVRSESAPRLKPFGPETPCAMFTLSFCDGDREPWNATLAITAERLDNLLPGMGAAAKPASHPDGATGAAFQTIPLPLNALLAEVDLSLGQLERLTPGDEIPISVPREIPLRIGAQVFAHGNAGTNDDRMAIALTRVNAASATQTQFQRLKS